MKKNIAVVGILFLLVLVALLIPRPRVRPGPDIKPVAIKPEAPPPPVAMSRAGRPPETETSKPKGPPTVNTNIYRLSDQQREGIYVARFLNSTVKDTKAGRAVLNILLTNGIGMDKYAMAYEMANRAWAGSMEARLRPGTVSSINGEPLDANNPEHIEAINRQYEGTKRMLAGANAEMGLFPLPVAKLLVEVQAKIPYTQIPSENAGPLRHLVHNSTRATLDQYLYENPNPTEP